MMKRVRQVTVRILLAATCAFVSCSKDPYWAYFTSEDLEWFPYDTATVQDQFIDQSGSQHSLILLHRNVLHESIGDATRDLFNNRAVAELMLDTTHISIDLTKIPHRGWLRGWYHQLRFEIVVADNWTREDFLDEVYYQDSLVVGSTIYNDVIVAYKDTIGYPNQQCWRFYYGKSKGLLRVDFRNGRYYEIQ